MENPLSIPAIEHTLSTLPLDARVKRLVLFGSHAKGNAQEHSDLDFFLDSGRRITGLAYFELKGRLEDAFGCDVDLIPDVDLIAGSPVEKEIMRYGVTVYGG